MRLNAGPGLGSIDGLDRLTTVDSLVRGRLTLLRNACHSCAAFTPQHLGSIDQFDKSTYESSREIGRTQSIHHNQPGNCNSPGLFIIKTCPGFLIEH